MKVLFVCASNTHRSMAAEIILRNLWKSWSHEQPNRVLSAGTQAGPYKVEIPESILKYLKKRYKVPKPETIKSQQLTPSLFHWADKIVYMEPKHEKMIQMRYENQPLEGKLVALGAFGNPKTHSIRLPDSKHKEKFNLRMSELEVCVKNLSTEILKEAPLPTRRYFPRIEDKGCGVIINIRGVNGSGKSKVIFDLLKKYKTAIPVYNKAGNHILHYDLNVNPSVFILGDYSTDTGGCDVISKLDSVNERITELAQQGSVIFEGIIVSCISKRWIDLASSLDKHKFIFGLLDTPFETCYKRRVERDGFCNRLNLADKLGHFRAAEIHLTLAMQRLKNISVRYIAHEDATRTVLDWLKERLL